MLRLKRKIKSKYTIFFLILLAAIILFVFWYIFLQKPSNIGNWQDKVAVLSTAEFKDNLVTVRNVRNFQYPNKENDQITGYYDKTYDLDKVQKTWFITEPFKPGALAAHTMLSFEFSNGDYLAITIEARLQKDQKYNIYKGIFHTYPLIYIATDEKDAILLRANVRKSNVYLYPIRSTPEQSRILLVDMLQKMNELATKPSWYSSIWANCTSSIGHHVNKIWPDALSDISWQLLFATGKADELALKKGLIDSDLPIEQAREKYLITAKSQKAGYVDNYSQLIRQN
jgi:hypothetical protein